ncbi:hypothetical protein ACF06W_11615 [Streptomyces albus]|uniref:hypothetical protein n=1 Tax=Streptomyces albus TaxID=1888 RepID=UPI0036FE7DD3
MIGGDLDSVPLPPVYIVWEHLLGMPGPRWTKRGFDRRVRWRRHRSALGLYCNNVVAVDLLWELWSEDRPISIVTYLPPPVAAYLPERLDQDVVPHTRLLVDSLNAVGRSLALQPGVRIAHGIPAHRLRYGPRGVLVPPQSPELLREML